MGYKSIIRSISAASNRVSREYEREQKREMRKQEQQNKKIAKINDKRQKVLHTLDEIYAKGKISDIEYREFKKREDEITLDFIAVGKTAAISLAKRYITGKIDKEEFIKIQETIVPDLIDEKKLLKKSVSEFENNLKEFKNSCKNKNGTNCQFCGVKKGFFKPLYDIDELELCGTCKKNLNKIKKYAGFNGKYLVIEPFRVSFDDINRGLKIETIFDLNSI